MSFRLSHVPVRLAAGSFILNAGLGKWSGDETTATGIHGMAAGTYPFLKKVEPSLFLKALAASEIAVGAALLAPVVSSTKAGVALTGFAGGLLGLYARTPSLRNGLRPTQQGTPIAKDVWLLGIGTSLVVDGVADHRKAKRNAKVAAKLHA
jgi:hypothetical protein